MCRADTVSSEDKNGPPRPWPRQFVRLYETQRGIQFTAQTPSRRVFRNFQAERQGAEVAGNRYGPAPFEKAEKVQLKPPCLQGYQSS